MSHHHEGDAAGIQFFEKSDHLVARTAIEVAGRLVSKKNCGVGHDRTSDRYTLALSSRELVGDMVHPLLQTDARQGRFHSLSALCCGQSAERQRQLDVLKGRQIRNEMEKLEDKPDLLAAGAGLFFFIQGDRIPALDEIMPLAWAIEQAEAMQQG